MKATFYAAAAASFLVSGFAGMASAEGVDEPWAESPFRCEPGETYVMNVMVSGVEYWFPVYEMFKQAAHQFGCEADYTGTPEYDISKQIASFQQALTKQPAGILLHPMMPDPFIGPINQAIEQGTAIVTFAADSPNSNRTSYITSDNFREGAEAARQIAEALGGKGQYAVLENPGQDNHDRRIAAFIAEMDQTYPGMELVGRASTGQDPNKAYQATLSLAQAHPDLDAIFMPEASSAMGAAQAAKEIGGDLKVMSVDVNASVLDMIQAGEMFAAINPNQGAQGYYGFLLLWLAAHPELIDPMNDFESAGFNPMSIPVLDNGFSVVTQENAGNFYWDKYLKKRGTRGVDG
ncbi:substrate-binding domain-containing protein [Celeribacter baekdonensis]|jgi:ribose transport system substrate-binding protein|uniref:Transporter n=1 Tax=Celeribacter baekdonensis TaxID=875171 RepID=A0A2R4M4Q5_9RHOB|nr:substrate-binding domain-containing protein [Celeribacter baekdonensis]AVW92136.1 transporter [Celeribacter baekdonensis]|tara:strand:+ start:14325 stop:15371 length:1047 start_codon:yes stop_codon:yes gene_type:complete